MMLLGPAPLAALLGEEHVWDHRDLHCPRYGACLDRAAREEWTSWTCTQCARFSAAHRAPSGARRDFQPHSPGGCRQPARAATVRTGCRSAPAARPRRGADRERPGTAHSVEATTGRLTIRLQAPSLAALFVEAGRAVADAIRGCSSDPVVPCEEEVAVTAPDREGLLGAWLQELELRSDAAGARFTEHDIVSMSDGRIVASVRGARLAGLADPMAGATWHAPSIEQRDGAVTATVVLDV